MRNRLADWNEALEKSLYKKGFHEPGVRALIRCQLNLALGTCLLVALLVRGDWAPAYVAGASLGTLNFLALAKVIQQLVFVQRGAVTALLVSFYGRLLVTGFLLFALIVWARLSITGLLCGLSTVVAAIVIWGGIHFVHGKNIKEA